MLLFSSFGFLIFSFIVITIYYLIAEKYRISWLLASSYFFYLTYSVQGAVILFLITLFTFITAKRIFLNSIHKKKILWGSIFVLLAVLFCFKYLNFFAEILNHIIQGLSAGHQREYQVKVFDILISVGISFYIFQSLGYLIGVYKNKVPAEENFICYALFLSYFPKLVSDPIEKAESLIPQFKQHHQASYEKVVTDLDGCSSGILRKL